MGKSLSDAGSDDAVRLVHGRIVDVHGAHVEQVLPSLVIQTFEFKLLLSLITIKLSLLISYGIFIFVKELLFKSTLSCLILLFNGNYER